MSQDSIWMDALDSLRVGACLISRDHQIHQRNQTCRSLLERIGIPPDSDHFSSPELSLPQPDAPDFPQGIIVAGRLIRLGLLPVEDSSDRWILSLVESDLTPEHLALIESLSVTSAAADLASSIAHRFNNTLTVVVGQADLLAARLPPNDPFASSLNSIREQGNQASDLARQILRVGMSSTSEAPIPDLVLATHTALSASHPDTVLRSQGDRLSVRVNRGHLFRALDVFLDTLSEDRQGPQSVTVSHVSGGHSTLPAILLPITNPWALLTIGVEDDPSDELPEEFESDDDLLNGLLGALKRSGCHIFRTPSSFVLYLPQHV